MRLIIHYVADIHQPLHAESRYNLKYPNGDRGGNSFKLPYTDGTYNLHSAYDSVMYEFTQDAKLPLSTGSWSNLEFNVDTLLKRHPQNTLSFDVNNLEFTQWAKDSFKIVQDVVYKDIDGREKRPLPDDYISTVQKILTEQIVIGGFRLANLLKFLLKNASVKSVDTLFLQ